MKKLFSKLAALAALALGAFTIQSAAAKAPTNADAAGGSWSLIGSLATKPSTGFANWSTDVAFTWNATNSRYELEITLTQNDQFKIRRNSSWDDKDCMCWWEEGNTSLTNQSTYLQNDGTGNFKVKATNTYLLTLGSDIDSCADRSTMAKYFQINPLSTDPVDPTPDPEPGDDTWGLIGSMTSWSSDIPFELNEEGTAYELEHHFNVGDLFKIRRNNSWADGDVMGWYNDNTNINNHRQYLKEATTDGNFEVTVEGDYLLSLASNISSTSPFNNAFTITKLSDEPIDPTPDTWGLVGTMTEWGTNEISFEWNADENRFELEIHFNVGDEFKIRRNNSWADADVMGWYNDNANIENHRQYLQESTKEPGNIEVTVAGTYLLTLASDISTTTPFNSAFLITLLSADPVETPADRAEAFLRDWDALRNEEGSICDNLEEPTALKEMLTRYDELDAEAKAIVDAAEDRHGNTVKDSVEYLKAMLAAQEEVTAEQTTMGTLLTVAKEHKSSIAIVIGLIAMSFAGYVVLNKKRKLVK